MSTLRILLTLLRKDFRLFRGDKAALSLTFLIPVLLIWLFGQVFGIQRGSSGPAGIPLAVAGAEQNPGAASLLAALKKDDAFRIITTLTPPDGPERPLTAHELPALIRDHRFRFALVLPPAGAAPPLEFRLLSNPQNEIETRTVNGLLHQAIAGHLPDFLGAPAPDVFSKLVRIQHEPVVGQEVKAPAAARIVGGWAVMFLLFALSTYATSIFEEKRTGIYQRLLAGPVTRTQIVFGKFCWGVVMGVVQLVTLFLAGQVMFGMEVVRHLPALIVLSAAAAAACTAFGLTIAAVSPTPEAARGLATFLILCMSALGGAWFPISFMPEFIQGIARGTVVHWTLEGFAGILWAGGSLTAVLPQIALLCAAAAALMAFAAWRFQRARVFG